MGNLLWNRTMDRLKIKYKLLAALLPFILLSYLIFFILIYFVSFRETQNIVNDQAVVSVVQKAQIVDDYLAKLTAEADGFSFNTDNQALFSVDQQTLSMQGQSALQGSMRKAMYNFIVNGDEHVQDICMRNAHGDSYLFLNGPGPASELMDRTAALESSTQKLGGRGLFSYGRLKDGLVTFTRTVYDPGTGRELGTLLIDFDMSFLPGAGTADGGNDDASLVIVNSKGTVVTNTSPLTEENLQAALKSRGEIHIGGTKYRVVRQSSNYSDWVTVGLINESRLYQNIYHVLILQVILVLLCLTTVVLLIYLVSSRISRQFQVFIRNIGRTNNMTERAMIHMDSNDEFRELADVYNDMIGRIDNLIKAVYAKGQLVRSAEYKAFQAQINPHFLYNTLDCIIGLVELGRTEETKKTIGALASIMRFSIKGESILSVRENMVYIEKYIYIEKMRYQDKLSFLVDVPESMLDYRMPKLILQPLIENAIVHGVSDLLGQGKIWIFGRECGEDIEFYVRDNGAPFPQDLIDRIAASDFTSENMMAESGKSIGLMNMQTRIQLLYGNKYGLTIRNLPNGGASVRIWLPKIKKGDENHETFDRGRRTDPEETPADGASEFSAAH